MGGSKNPNEDPIAFTDWANDKLLEYFPSGETSRIMGFPTTCKVVAPAPNKSIENNKI